MVYDDRRPVPGIRRFLLLTVALASLSAACHSEPSAKPGSEEAWAVVNDQAITAQDVDRAYRRAGRDTSLDETDAFAAKLALLDELIDQEVFLAKARELEISVSEPELDKAYAEARKDVPEDAYKQGLAQRSLTDADMREGLRRELVVQKLFAGQVSAKISVTDQEVAAFYEANKSQFNRDEEAYRVAQIVVTPVKEERVTNRTGSDAGTVVEAVRKYRMIMDKLKAGAQFGDVAADYSEDPDSAPNRGDLGFIPVSVVRKYPAQLRDAVLNSTPGQAKAMGDSSGFVIVLVPGKDAAGQKSLDTPGVKEGISQTLKLRREQLLRAAYVETLRNAAAIENLVARRLVEAQGNPPASLLGSPGAR